MLSKFGKSNLPDHLGGWDFVDSFLFPNGWETRLYQLAFPGTDLEQLGFHYPETEEGDVLCVLKDNDLPVLLRKQRDYYTFVGEAFVVDLDLGKSAQDSSSGLKWFELR
ncbi:hypothetical protein CEP53_009840 [Fusarium sp. AF-6]|nr:hypothetical protein CEP53_009840 [Fusarium sp. AF-6]